MLIGRPRISLALNPGCTCCCNVAAAVVPALPWRCCWRVGLPQNAGVADGGRAEAEMMRDAPLVQAWVPDLRIPWLQGN